MIPTTVRAPVSHTVPIAELRPTQMTVGFREVNARRDRLKKIAKEHGEKFIRKHVIPVVRGPKDRLYVIDHHHLSCALLGAGLEDVSVTVVLNLVRLDRQGFFVYLDNVGLLHPFDEKGQRREYGDIPKTMKGLADDPFRSLAGALRRAGGYAKDTVPFSEFLWADFLRRHIAPADVEKRFDTALEEALHLAKSPAADFLPGWCGPMDGDTE